MIIVVCNAAKQNQRAPTLAPKRDVGEREPGVNEKWPRQTIVPVVRLRRGVALAYRNEHGKRGGPAKIRIAVKLAGSMLGSCSARRQSNELWRSTASPAPLDAIT